jgi:hypothetical protein
VLTRGEIYFAPRIENRAVGAVFIGDGELSLTPPTEVEKHNLALFIDQVFFVEESECLFQVEMKIK